METLLFLIFLNLVLGSTGLPDYTGDVECHPEFYDNKVKLHLTFDPDNPKLNNITNGKFRSQNYANLSRIDHKLQNDSSDTRKHFIEMEILYQYTRYFLYAYFMNNNECIIAKICQFTSTELTILATPVEETTTRLNVTANQTESINNVTTNNYFVSTLDKGI